MRNRFYAFFPSMVLALALVMTGGVTSGDAQTFANDSVIGTYAVTIETKFIKELGLGICTADGLPNATGLATLQCPNIIINQRDDDQGRETVTASFLGRYSINNDGTGTMTAVLSQTGTTTTPFVLNTNIDLLVTMSRLLTGNVSRDAVVMRGMQVEGAHQITNIGGEELVTYKFEKLD